jgi:hypothetical protein
MLIFLNDLYVVIFQRCEDDKPFQSPYQVSKEKARSLGINFIPFETSIKEIIESLKEKGFVTF